MIKSELISAISKQKTNLSNSLVEIAVNQILKQMTDGLAQGENIEIRGFGTFSLRCREAQIGRNPKTGESVQIAKRHVIHFKTAKDLKSRVNQLASQYSIQK
ncbi:MAG: integration host factor subunit beta [Methylococcales bacterium]